MFDCKADHDITNRETCLMVDKFSSVTSQKEDGPIGVEKFICAKGNNSKNIANATDKHWSLVELDCNYLNCDIC